MPLAPALSWLTRGEGVRARGDGNASAAERDHDLGQNLQERRIVALRKGAALGRAAERRHQRLTSEVIELVKRVRFNNARLGHLVEQFHEMNRP